MLNNDFRSVYISTISDLIDQYDSFMPVVNSIPDNFDCDDYDEFFFLLNRLSSLVVDLGVICFPDCNNYIDIYKKIIDLRTK